MTMTISRAAMNAIQDILRVSNGSYRKIYFEIHNMLSRFIIVEQLADTTVDLKKFREPVIFWRTHAEIGEIALDIRAPYRRSAEEYRSRIAEANKLLSAIDKAESFQQRVAPWMQECFGAAIASDVCERGDRLLEETLELLQSHGYDRTRVATLCDYVYNRPVGEPAQEVGGVMVTLAAYCLATGLDMHAAGDAELARINDPAIIEKIREKQKAKNRIHGVKSCS